MIFECGWKYNIVEEAEDVRVGSNLYSEVPEEGRGKGILCAGGGINLVYITGGTERASRQMEGSAQFSGSQLRCSLLLISISM